MLHPDFPRVRNAVFEAIAGHGPVLLVDSPPGAGKTLLVEELATTLAFRNATTAVTMPGHEQCLEFARRFRRDHPTIAVRLWLGKQRVLPARLADGAQQQSDGSVRLGPGGGPEIQLGTIAKLGSLSDSAPQFDVILVDEAYQATYSTYEPLLARAKLHVLIGDPGQLPPTVRIDPEPFETLAYRPHLPVPEELFRHDPNIPHLRLEKSYRFPEDTAALLQPFYPDLPFSSGILPRLRAFSFADPAQHHDPINRALDLLAAGTSLVILALPRTTSDTEAVTTVAKVLARIRARNPILDPNRYREDQILGCVEPRVALGDATQRAVSALGSRFANTMTSTPEVWQGLERAFIVTRHPISARPTPFDLDPGRLCVAVSRHQCGCVVVARTDTQEILNNARHDAGARPLGVLDRHARGRDAHLAFWLAAQSGGHIIQM